MSTSFLDNDPILINIARHDRSFCSLIECIPKDLYRAVEEDEEVLNAKYFKHKRAPMTADERKLSRKQRRREAYGVVDNNAESVDNNTVGDDHDVVSEDETYVSNAITTAPSSNGLNTLNSESLYDTAAGSDNKKRKFENTLSDRRRGIFDNNNDDDGDVTIAAAVSTFDEGELLAAEGIEMLKKRLKVIKLSTLNDHGNVSLNHYDVYF